MATAGMANFEDFFAYLMNNALYKYIMTTLGITYTDQEFYEFDLDQFSIVAWTKLVSFVLDSFVKQHLLHVRIYYHSL